MLNRICALSISGLLAFGSVAFADVSCNLEYTPEKAEIRVNGESNGHTVITVAPASVTTDTLGSDALPTAIKQTEAYGEYDVYLGLPLNTPGGKYKVYISSNSGETDKSFDYINTSEADPIVSMLNSKNGSGFNTYVQDNAIKIGIDIEDEIYKGYSSFILETLDAMEFSSSSDFYYKYRKLYAICYLKSLPVSQKALALSSYERELGIDYINDFENESRLSEEHRSELLSVLSNTNYKNYILNGDFDFPDIFEKSKPLALIRCAKNWISIKETITETFSFTYSSLLGDTKYKSIKDKDAVFELMKTMTFNTIESVDENFQSAVNTVYQNQNKDKPSGGGSSGGGGGSISVPTINNPVSTPVDTAPQFSDLPSSHWAYKAVSALSSKGVVSGYTDGSFKGDNNITRAEFTKLISAFISGSTEQNGKGFDDVPYDAWYYDCVMKASAAGIVNGTDKGFEPDEYIKRQDAMLIIFRLLSLQGGFLSGNFEFKDSDNISSYAKEAVASLGASGIVNGSDGMVYPHNTITRNETAQLIYNAFIK